MWGSRLFGNEEDDEKSDFDFICIIDDFVPPLPTQNSFGKLKKVTEDSTWDHINQIRLAHFGSVQTGYYNGKKIDVAVYEESFWNYLVQKHIIWTLSFQFFTETGLSNKVVIERKKIRLQVYSTNYSSSSAIALNETKARGYSRYQQKYKDGNYVLEAK